MEAIQPGRGAQAWRSIGLHTLDDGFLDTVTAGLTARAPIRVGRGRLAALREQPGLAVIGGPAVRQRNAETAKGSSF